MTELNRATGVDYEALDAVKRYAQEAARSTPHGLAGLGLAEVSASRGETAYVVEMGEVSIAFTPEGLGTKNLIADAVAELVGSEAGYYPVGWDTVAMIANDLAAVGARPIVISPHWAVGDRDWLANAARFRALVDGWKDACLAAGAAYGAGETAELKRLVFPQTIVLSGAGWGIIKPKERFTAGEKLRAGDHIILIESSGIHANGVTAIREKVIPRLERGYLTPLSDGKLLAEALLKPTHIYARLQQAVFETGADIHCMTHISGHGWRKLMRAQREDVGYRMHTSPPVAEEFDLIQKTGEFTDAQMYAAYNMGAGFAFYVAEGDAGKVQSAAQKLGYKSWDAGVVEAGPKQVIIEPKEIRFTSESLQIR